jgi:oxalate decarboxylase/phosphoglucose isomerase-like protein (cupin superfamily)
MIKLEPNNFATQLFDWGRIKWRVSPDVTNDGASLTAGDVVVFPNKGHARHDHPDADELIYVVSGVGEQMINDAAPFKVAAGDMFYIPKGVPHSTFNKGWDNLVLLVVYAPGGAERALRGLPDFSEVAVGVIPDVNNVKS